MPDSVKNPALFHVSRVSGFFPADDTLLCIPSLLGPGWAKWASCPSLPTGRAGVGLLWGRRFRRIDECQTIWSFSASLLAIFVTGGPLGANKRFLAVLSKCWQSVVWILLTRIWYRKRAWKSPNGLAKEALLRWGCSLFGFQVWLFRKLKRPEREQP